MKKEFSMKKNVKRVFGTLGLESKTYEKQIKRRNFALSLWGVNEVRIYAVRNNKNLIFS
jgi:hypothetical protein